MVTVIQLGARMHYGVARILSENGLLGKMYTDFYSKKAFNKLTDKWPFTHAAAIKKMRTRSHHNLSDERVTHFPFFGLKYPFLKKRCKTNEEKFRHYIEGGKQFNEKVINNLKKGSSETLYTYNSAGLEVIQWAKKNGIKIIHEQTSSLHSIEKSLLIQEQAKFPDWGGKDEYGYWSKLYSEREEEELRLADVIICGSDFVKGGIISSNLVTNKISVVPYGVDGRRALSNRDSKNKESKLNILTIGNINIQKGSPYVLQAAKELQKIANFRMVGDYSSVPNSKIVELSSYVELTGKVNRTEIYKHYEWADVFLLPSICEGSATVTYEALQYGLPLIVTENTGSLITDAKEGFVIPIRDYESIVSSIEELQRNEDLLHVMSVASVKTSQQASYSAYSNRLLDIIRANMS